jgi:hypothetical protein
MPAMLYPGMGIGVGSEKRRSGSRRRRPGVFAGAESISESAVGTSANALTYTVVAVPESGTCALLGIGLAIFGARRFRRKVDKIGLV